jgi:hypothetical protein
MKLSKKKNSGSGKKLSDKAIKMKINCPEFTPLMGSEITRKRKQKCFGYMKLE